MYFKKEKNCYFEWYKKSWNTCVDRPEIGLKHFDKLKPEPGPTRKARPDLQLCACPKKQRANFTIKRSTVGPANKFWSCSIISSKHVQTQSEGESAIIPTKSSKNNLNYYF